MEQSNPGSNAYNITFLWKIFGHLQPDALEQSINAMMQRHEVLRTVFPLVNGLPSQKIRTSIVFQLENIDLRELPDAARDAEAKRLASLAGQKPFDLVDGPLIRLQLFCLRDREHLFLLSVHHIIFDGTSLGVFFRDLNKFYKSFTKGTPPNLPDMPIQYADYSVWQQEQSRGSAVARQLDYWRKELGGLLPRIELPLDHPRPAVQTLRGAIHWINLNRSTVDALNKIQHQERTTLSSVFLAAFKILLFRYTRQEDLIVGTLVNGRNLPELRDQIGFFVNNHAIRTFIEADMTFREVLYEVFESSLCAIENQDVPFDKVVEAVKPPRDLSATPIFQILFSFQSLPGKGMDLEGLEIQPEPLDWDVAKYDLSLDINETAAGATCSFEYNIDLFELETIQRMAGHFVSLLEAAAADPDKPIQEFPMLTLPERNQILIDWNRTEVDYPRDLCLHQVFELQVAKTPEKTAIEFGGKTLTYTQLNERANQMAHYLISLGVTSGMLVGLSLERSLEMVIAMLAILKADATYVPLDPAFPHDRLRFIIEDIGMPFLLTEECLVPILPKGNHQFIILDKSVDAISVHSTENPQTKVSPDQLAYVLYTSGSTGKPKGVQIPHSAVVNFLNSMRREPGFSPDDILLAITTLSFDIAGLEIFLPITTGGRVVIAKREFDGQVLAGMIEAAGITVMQATPATWRLLLQSGWKGNPRLKILCGGEPLTADLAEALLDRCGELWNLYGPTETTIWSAVIQVHPGDPIVVGPPIDNTQIYILDESLQPVPIGVPGELCIGGDGLARGYFNRPELTAEKFIPNPFTSNPGARIYRTGDLARFRSDGTIDFLGRKDNQVKVRGYRIELGEIETTLGQHPSIQQNVVVAREDDQMEKRLVAYLIVEGQPVTIEELRHFLMERLPEYMVPSAFVILQEFPLTPNGKIDRRSLPPPDSSRPELNSDYIEPRNDAERVISDIWKEVLNLEKVGVRDNFFDLGGHSLLIVKVHSRLREAFSKPILMVEMFRYSTIESLANYFTVDRSEDTFSQVQRRAEKQVKVLSEGEKHGDPKKGVESIAIIGMSGRFPGAKNVNEFWRNLSGGVESIRRFTDDELLANGVSPEDLGNPNYVKAGPAFEDLEMFDASFFGYNPKEAEYIDPQQRIFLETAWEALECAGYNPEAYEGAISVYAGVSMNTYGLNLGVDPEGAAVTDAYQVLIGNDKDFLTTRVAYKLNLRGPCFTVQTGCSTSLVAVQLACQSLLNHQTDIALAGGVCANVSQGRGYFHQEGMILSPDGHCRAFDEKAHGTVSGMGSGIVVLKRLSEALSDGDTIHAVILGGALNNDGAAKVGYTAPSISGQSEVVVAAHGAAQVDPATIGYVEAHGTGTPMGDPIEVAALTQAFRVKTQQKQFCAIGSVKSNIGHLDVASGVAGIIKAALALKNKQIPPTLHFEKPNPKIDLANSPFYVNAELQEWNLHNGTPRRAGVSSFGIGGTNAHVILEEAPPRVPSAKSRPYQLITLSARTPSALETAGADLRGYLTDHSETNLADAAYTLQTGRKHFDQRRFLVCRDSAETIAALGNDGTGFTSDEVPTNRRVVFLFTGQGVQHPQMGAELYETEPLFRETINYCSELLQSELQCDLRNLLYPKAEGVEEARRQLNETRFTQPALFVIEYAMAKVWMQWGIKPESMIGHSIGEYVAACLADVFSLEDALRLVAARGRLMQGVPAGSMLAVPLPFKEIEPYLTNELSLAASNAPALNVVSGPTEQIEKLANQLSEQGLQCKRLHTSHAFHSAMMEPILEAFTDCVRTVKLSAPTLPYISNVTGTWITAAEATDPNYWARHLREAVQFSAGMRELLKESDRVFLEVGPGQTLTSLTKMHSSSGMVPKAFSSMRHPNSQESDVQHLLTTLGQLWLLGTRMDWSGFYIHERRCRIPLPTYPFERQRYWVDARPGLSLKKAGQSHRIAFEKWFAVPSWKRSAIDHAAAEKAAEKRLSWLLFVDGCGLGANLARQLKELGQLVAVVSVGKQFEKKSNDTYVINPAEPQDYRALFESLAFLGRVPTKIIHFWAVTPDERKKAPAVSSSLDRCFYSLLHLAQTIGEQASDLKIEIKVISNALQEVTGDESIVPEKSVALGPCRVIPQEFENIQCSTIDVVLPDSAAKAEKFNELLLDEIFASTTEGVVAHRGTHRWVECFEPTPIPRERFGKPALRENGVYLITGGLGGIGLALAEHLAQAVQAKLALISRSPLPERDQWNQWLEQHDLRDLTAQKIRKLESLERLGSEVLVINADVTNSEEMEGAVNQARSRFGSIHGVIHAAGVAGGGIIQIKTRQAAERVMASKIYGTIALKKALGNERPDFVVLCSSINAFLGGVGQVDYCAANAFLDAYARKHRSWNFISVNWYAWQEVGMAVNTEVPQELQAERARSLMMGIRPSEGAEAFSRILNQSNPQIIVSPEDIGAQIEHHAPKHSGDEELAIKEQVKKHARPQITSTYLAPRNEYEKALAGIWQQVLGIEQVGVHDDFFKLGGHSLLALTVFAKIKKLTGKEIPLATLFEAPTIEKLAVLIGGGEVVAKALPDGRSNLVVPIKATGTRTPFFCIHGVGGAVIEYSHLASYLDPDQPFYGIQAQGLDGKEPWLKTIEEMATRYIQEIKRIQPEGPYSIGGSSFGGVVAYEMAQQLHSVGENVSLLAFFDSYGKDYPTPLPNLAMSRHLLSKSMARWDMHLSNLRMMKAREWPGYVREKLGKLPVRCQRKMKKLQQDVRFLFLPRVLRNQFKWTGDDGGDLWHFKLPKSYTDVATANYRSCLNYRHKPYSGPAVLFRASKQPAGIQEDPTNGWGTLVQGGLEIIEVPGYHGAIVREPLVRKLGVEFNSVLSRKGNV